MKAIKYLLLGAACSCLTIGCASLRPGTFVKVLSVETLAPDSLSQIHVDTKITLAKRALSSRSRLIIWPRLMQGDSLVSDCPIMVLDAPIYVQKTKRRMKLEGYVDSLAEYATAVDITRELILPYRTTLTVPEQLENGRIIAAVSANGCGHCSTLDTVDVAYIANIPTLIEPQKSLELNWIEPEFVIRPKVMKGKGEALLQFIINRSDINLDLGNNRREMEDMLVVLEKIISDSLATLNSLDIYGMASADGSYAFNTTLARNRAASAKRWLVARLHMPSEQAALISTGSRPEGWEPVLAAMRADGHPDTLAVADILSRCNAENDDSAEYRIRRLPCWPDIRANYLQKDRKVEYEYSYTIRSFTTDEELLAMYDRRPDAFNEEELFRVTTLKKDPREKEEVYRTILHYFPQSYVAANNLAVLLLREGRVDEAEAVLDSLGEFTPEMINTKAAVYIYRHDYERAIELLEANETLPEARYNLGLLMANVRQLDRAYELLKNYNDTNSAVVALSVGRNEEAAAIMAVCDDRSPRAEYVRALIAARSGDGNGVVGHLEAAVADLRLRQRARTEADFVPYASRPDFIERISNEKESKRYRK